MDDVYCCPGATEDNEEDIYYCYNCWEKIFFECHNCENIFYKEDGFEDENGELYCQNCVEQ